MPNTTSTIEPTATAADSSPSARQAAMPVTTAPAHEAAQDDRVLGGPGAVGPPDGARGRSSSSRGRSESQSTVPPRPASPGSATAPGQATAGAAPVAHGAERRPVGLGGGEDHRGAAVEQGDHGAQRLLGHGLGRGRVGGQAHLEGDGLGRRAFHLAHHELAAVGGGGPVHPAPAVAGPVGRTPRGSPMLHGRVGAPRRRSVSSPPRGSGRGRPRRGPTCSSAGSATTTRSRPPQQAEGRRARHLEHDVVEHAAPRG